MTSRRVKWALILLASMGFASEVDAEIMKDLEFFRTMEVFEAQEKGEVDEAMIRALAEEESQND
jgi:hypothetical protein